MSELIYKRDKTRADVNELIGQHKNLVYYILGKMGQLNNSDAESAAFEALWDAIETFDIYSKTCFSSYACCLMRNAINDVQRKAMAHDEHVCTVAELPENIALSLGPEVDNVSIVSEVYRHFDNFIKCKNGCSRNVLQLWYANNFEISNTKIAKLCNCSVSYVSRVQQDFRAYLSGKLKL